MDDNQLIELFFERSEKALPMASSKYGGYCYKIIRNILNSDEDSDECLNDVYLKLWNTIPPERPKNFLAYAGKVARNIAINRYNYNNAEKRNPRLDTIYDEIEECIPSSFDTQKEIEAGEVTKSINAFLEDLNAIERNVFLRRYWYSESISDISDRFDFSQSKIKSMLMRTRKKLKTHLEKDGVFDE